MSEFEQLLNEHQNALERFVCFKIGVKMDADDVLQEVCLTAYQKFGQLRDQTQFKAWLISIARNKCNDYFRGRANLLEEPIDKMPPGMALCGRMTSERSSPVRDTLNLLAEKDRQILYLYFFQSYPQAEIAKKLGVPLGTVKSRLYHAKQRFRLLYPFPPREPKGGRFMSKIPELMPEYTITRSEKEPFSVKWEELMGWFLVPRLGERLSWAMYDFPEKKRTESVDLQVVGEAEVHGIAGVEIHSLEYDPMECNAVENANPVRRDFVAQLTDTHCRLLAESHVADGVKKYYTFLDGDAFLDNWGFGEDNCGNETLLAPKGLICRSGTNITSEAGKKVLDVVGRYAVSIAGKTFDTVCAMDVETYNSSIATEQFVDKNGRTVLWRRFNRDDWALDRYGQRWTERLPGNERITINGQIYVHWYDCITDYIL